MKVKCRSITEWRPWFAWTAVSVAPGDCRWLEWVDRRCVREDIRVRFWDYRARK